MAPLIGALADKSRSPWGRRRPFMVGGSIVVAACLITLGWSREIMQSVMGKSASVRHTNIELVSH